MIPTADGIIRAQPGPQELALACGADIVIYGGAAGGGKTSAIFLAVIQYAHIPSFGAEVFRRTTADIEKTGGLWDESLETFPLLRAKPNENKHRWTFPSGATCTFSHMEHPQTRFNWRGAQIPLLAFDQVESFTEAQFWYLTSRLRDPSGRVRPWALATCNPVPDDDETGGWLRKLIDWWIDADTGLAIERRSGVARWMIREEDDGFEWHADRASALQSVRISRYRERLIAAGRAPAAADAEATLLPKSLVFIESKLEDNRILEQLSPGYRATLEGLPRVERERVLGRNWNVKPAAGLRFDRAWFEIVDAAPAQARQVRYWDKAGSEGRGDYTAGVRIAAADNGWYYVEDVVRGQWSALGREKTIKETAEADGYDVEVWQEEEGGSGGKESAEGTVRNLAGYAIRSERVTGSKWTRSGGLAAQAEARNVKVVKGAWNEAFLREMHAFTGEDGGRDDQVDAACGGFNKLARASSPGVRVAGAPEPSARRIFRLVKGGVAS